MQNCNALVSGGYTTTPIDRKGVAIGDPVWSQVGQTCLIISSASVTKGDFKTPLPWSYSVRRGDRYFHGRHIHSSTKYNGTIWDGWGFYGGTITDAFYKAAAVDPYNKCLGKLYDQLRSTVDLSVDLYQVKQSVATVKRLANFAAAVASPLKTFANTAKSLIASGKIRRGSALAGNLWLEWQYGLKPSISTIYELTDDLFKHVMDPEGFYVVKARASTKAETDDNVSGGPWGSQRPATWRTTDSRRCELSLHYGIASTQLNAISQFSSLNPVSFVYENIPFSFVLDWIIDLGGYLRLMETSLMTGLEFKAGYRSDTRKKTTDIMMLPFSLAGYKETPIDVIGKQELLTFNRVLLAGLPKPQLPSLDVNLGTQRLLSAASLLRGLLK